MTKEEKQHDDSMKLRGWNRKKRKAHRMLRRRNKGISSPPFGWKQRELELLKLLE